MAKTTQGQNGSTGGANGSDPRSIRDRIRAANIVPRELVVIEEWDNAEIEVRGITLGQRSKLMSEAYDSVLDEGTGERRDRINYARYYPILLIATCYVPGTDERVFLPGESEFELVNSLNPRTVDKVARVAARLSGLSATEENGQGNPSGGTESSGSVSTSPSR